MSYKVRAWLLIGLTAVLCGAAIWMAYFYRSRVVATPAAMLKRIPTQDAVVLYIDFDALRRGGILQLLADSKAPEEQEYKQFLSKTEFDYQRDLDLAVVSFSPSRTFLLVKGRFDWKRIREYVASQGGSCYDSTCSVTGSKPDRKISFFPLKSNLMAMAVSRDPWEVQRLRTSPPNPRVTVIPRDPVWISVPPSTLKDATSLPAGTRMFATGMENAQDILIALGTQGKNFEVKLDVLCRASTDAANLVSELQSTTNLLREMIARENKKPNPTDLSGVLTAGVFRQDGRRVIGRWPLPQEFVQATLSGGSE